MWKNLVNNKVNISALNYLEAENSKNEKTKHILFCELKINEYLHRNVKTSISKTIFSVRSKTYDVKEYCPWKYNDEKCVRCLKVNETMEHFVHCEEYGETLSIDWKNIYENNMEELVLIAEFIEKRQKQRQVMLKQQEDGQASDLGSTAPGNL
jgi:hypothetical protein